MQTCIWPSGCHCHSLSLTSVKSRLGLPFWYRLTRVVPEKRPLNGGVCVSVKNPLICFLCCPQNPQNLSQSFHLKGVKTCFFILSDSPAFTAVCCYRPHWHCSLQPVAHWPFSVIVSFQTSDRTETSFRQFRTLPDTSVLLAPNAKTCLYYLYYLLK